MVVDLICLLLVVMGLVMLCLLRSGVWDWLYLMFSFNWFAGRVWFVFDWFVGLWGGLCSRVLTVWFAVVGLACGYCGLAVRFVAY